MTDTTNIPLVERLIGLLADTFACYRATHLYHWDVVGSNFVAVHQLLNDQWHDQIEAVDTIAEYVRYLGGIVPAGFDARAVADDLDVSQPWAGMVADLIEINRSILQSVQYAIEAAESVGDQGALNLLADRQTAHRNNIWRLIALVTE